MEAIAKITSKGQVTIPKKMRDMLGSDIVRFRVENERIILEPVRDLGGIFKKYGRGDLPFEREREIAWEKIADEYKEDT
ncbi:MAG: AbrB/MazE/SpoVT family DNA-binding domain-containing protein [Deltaproteobacteria bacterium]|uniref:AbrB/MazE/SpoVT family DNA-binding domain-containing protein n=1 Tax=Thermosulfidibacter takaii TaxID=412593 RepID=A0A7C0Y816_9BACT|nr:MAG: AbrB/MazE/SpoVT family DNA-binding domain-containing protein [Deltaproteobacteria bacterium]HDD53105.1 AbrB/MazE/SpoVT family DNA-binding domain-containing protein [Thermosulfidibacter takaii]